MKKIMGHFGQLTDPSTLSPETIIGTASQLAEGSINQTLDKTIAVMKSKEVQDFIEEHNLTPYIKDLTKDRIKTFLSLFGLWSVYKAIKSPVGLAVIAGAAIYVVTSNKEKVVQKVSSKVAQEPVADENNIKVPALHGLVR